MNGKHMIKAIVDIAIFLEFTGEESLDPDSALNAMERLSAELQCMSAEDRQIFSEQCRALSGAYGDKEGFVIGLSEALGIE
ncbi:hypothetical protein [Pandoraea sp. ISTKB]|uniref:hypothetical protein n=1 Tax=Pandoraea sp. ISTKB TaxID=1586708 RepID=UPI0008479EBE|nr:hypothetical protein [Pandoraea sp. ISTKB]ODP30904.1 hypothetical protein A9762_27645 [Pandoraea sp. ISTKB]